VGSRFGVWNSRFRVWGVEVQDSGFPVQGFACLGTTKDPEIKIVVRSEECGVHRVQGYLAYKKTHPPRTLL